MTRRLIGSTAVIGLVAVVAGCADDSVTAQCVQEHGWAGAPVVVRDDYCLNHTADDNGVFIFGGQQYRYYYGSDGPVGSRPRGGTTSPPVEDDDGYAPTVKTKSGSTIPRGGLGGTSGGYGGKSSGG
jgi:hypothetical protein